MDEQQFDLNHTFSALAHPTRRGMMVVLMGERMRVTDLAAQFDCSLNVASKHIGSLERAGLVQRKLQGREHWLSLNANPLSEAAAFVERYRKLWESKLDRLGAYLDSMAKQESTHREAGGPAKRKSK